MSWVNVVEKLRYVVRLRVMVRVRRGCTCFRSGQRASISALDLGIFSYAKYFIRIPGANKIRDYGSNLHIYNSNVGCTGHLR